VTGVGALNAFPTPTPQQMTNTLNNPPLANDPWLVHTLFPGIFGPTPRAQNAPAPAAAPGSAPAVAPTPPGPPGFNAAPPPQYLPPFTRGPIPFNMPQNAPPRAPRSFNLGYGASGISPAPAAPAAPSPMFTAIDRPNADIVGGPTVPGQLSAAPREPGGPAQMGALDLSGFFNRSQPVQGALAAQPGGGWQSAVGAPNMNNVALGSQILGGGWPFGGGGGQSAPAPVARAQRQPFSNSKFFGNPANWQYPANTPF
jgi:hypothetical protein